MRDMVHRPDQYRLVCIRAQDLHASGYAYLLKCLGTESAHCLKSDQPDMLPGLSTLGIATCCYTPA